MKSDGEKVALSWPRWALLAVWGLGAAMAYGTPCLAQDSAEAPAGEAREYQRIWWNQPDKIEALGLTPALRGELDELLATFFEGFGTEGTREAAMEDYAEALRTRDWDAAMEASQRAQTAVQKPIERMTVLMVSVLKKLSPEQHAKLVELYPTLIRRPWVQRLRRFQAGANP